MSTGVLKSSTTELCVRCTTNKPAPGARRCRPCQEIVNARQKELRQARKQAGLCKCGRGKPPTGRADCDLCVTEMRSAKNSTYRRRKLQGLCFCGATPPVGYKQCDQCRESDARRKAAERLKVFEHYGLACKCCGEDTYEFLEIDHIDGGGNDHRREIGAGQTYSWLIRNGFPPGFQTLCSNCNRAKFRYGVCPHQRKRAEEKTT